MKLLIPLVTAVLAGRGKDFERTYPAERCGDITKPQKGFWIDMGVPDDNIKMSDSCTQDSNAKRCTVWCKGFDQHVVMDREDDTKYDKLISKEKQKKFLVLCRCTQDDQGNYEDCKWTTRRRWSKKDYNEQQSGRMKRSSDEPRATLYCEDDTAQDERDSWNIKPKGNRQWKDSNKERKKYTSCGDMISNFPTAGGEWRCHDEDKNTVSHTDLPFKGSCQWGCVKDGQFEKRSARFTCYRPWIGQTGTKWEGKDDWRKFKGMGVRIHKQGLMTCDD